MSKTKASLCVITATALTVMTLFLLPFTPKPAVRTAIVSRGELLQTTLVEGVVAYESQQPVVSLQAGRLSGVYVAQGQRVKAGQLLFAMDTSAEEQALSMLASRRYAAERLTGGEAALAGATFGWDEQELAIRASIELKQLRAQEDGVVGAVYQQAGDYVADGALIGLVHSDGLCVTAAWQPGIYAQAQAGAAATVAATSGESVVYVQLRQTGAPALSAETGQYVQQLTFAPVGNAGLTGFEVGDRVMVEVLNRTDLDVPLAPVEAIDENGRLWLVRDGKAVSMKVDTTLRNDQYLYVPEALLGERIILLPDDSTLTEGCAVKEAKKR